MQFAPAVRPQLLDLIDALDDDTRGIASIWRELGRIARSRGLVQPCYESVRRIVHAQRAARRLAHEQLQRAAVVLAEYRRRARRRTRLLLDAGAVHEPVPSARAGPTPRGAA